MVYNIYTAEKKIPIPIALILLIILILAISLLIKGNPRVPIKESSENTIKSLYVTNVTSTSASIIVCLSETDKLELAFGPSRGKIDQIIFDDRDIVNQSQERRCHYFSLKNLIPGTYYFQPRIKGQLLSDKIETFTTASIPSVSKLTPLWGKIVDGRGKPVETGIVIATFSNSETLSTLVKSGDWLLPLHYLNNIPDNQSEVVMKVIADTGEANIKAHFKDTDKLKKTLVLNKTYDFTTEEKEVLGESINESSQVEKIDIVYPKENQVIPGVKPYFKGIALSNTKVKLAIDQIASFGKKSSKQNRMIGLTTNEKGLWSFVPSFNLSPGKHILTMNTLDENNKAKKIERNFIILKSGEAVLGDATPSATITPEEPTIAPSEIPTPTPTIEPIITEEPTVALPRSGMDVIPFSFFGGALVVIGILMILLF